MNGKLNPEVKKINGKNNEGDSQTNEDSEEAAKSRLKTEIRIKSIIR